jgi:arginine-tRNA-protein transferase
VDIDRPEPTEEKFALYERYLHDRHERQMDDSWKGFCGFLYESPVFSLEIVYRCAGRLLAVGLLDVEPTAISTIYCYFDPDEAVRSLGSFNVLWTIDYCRRQKVPHLYLGYYIRGCGKMEYKLSFRPCEVLVGEGVWQRRDR